MTCFREILGRGPNKPGAASSGGERVTRAGNVELKEGPNQDQDPNQDQEGTWSRPS